MASGAPERDAQRRRDLVRMKSVAAGLLLVAAVLYVVAVVVGGRDGGGGWGFVRVGAEAAMVGGLADWFAVTALFRRPLGLPVPHTAIIPTRKDALAGSLGDFVGENFLSEQVVRERLAGVDVAARIGAWLADPGHGRRVADEAATVLAGGLALLRDGDLQELLADSLTRRLDAVEVGPVLGGLMGPLVAEGAHHRLVDLVVDEVSGWLGENRDTVVRVVGAQAPGWSPRFVDDAVGRRAYGELLRVAQAVQADPDHELRGLLDAFLVRLAGDLVEDPGTRSTADEVVARLTGSVRFRSALGELVAAARSVLTQLVEDPASPLRRGLLTGVQDLARRLAGDPAFAAVVDRYVADAAGYVVTHYRSDITRLITDTVDRWDGPETARRIELQVGRDLQFIRVNGTVVGALVGLVLHTVTVLA